MLPPEDAAAADVAHETVDRLLYRELWILLPVYGKDATNIWDERLRVGFGHERPMQLHAPHVRSKGGRSGAECLV
jgi:hypothetical protein